MKTIIIDNYTSTQSIYIDAICLHYLTVIFGQSHELSRVCADLLAKRQQSHSKLKHLERYQIDTIISESSFYILANNLN